MTAVGTERILGDFKFNSMQVNNKLYNSPHTSCVPRSNRLLKSYTSCVPVDHFPTYGLKYMNLTRPIPYSIGRMFSDKGDWLKFYE
jgi:hypothetical protein